MRLYQYDDIRKLNQALGSFNRNKIPVSNINLVTVENKVQYFVLTDAAEDYKQKVESTTEKTAMKEIKVKKEEKKEEPKETKKVEVPAKV